MDCVCYLVFFSYIYGVDVMSKDIEKIFQLGFGKVNGSISFIDYEKILSILGEQYPPDCLFCAINKHIDVYSPKNHEEHRGASIVNYDNLIHFLEKIR